jgi:hypothetical protein
MRFLARMLVAGLLLVAPAARSQAPDAPVNANSGCPLTSTEPIRQRPGEPPPERLQAPDCDPDRLPTPTQTTLPGPIPADRWRIVDALGYPDNRIDPYSTNNPLKGDRPIFRTDDFSVLTATTNSLFEARQVPATLDSATGQLDGRQQFFDSQTATLDAVLYQGDTIFKPPDYQLRLTPTFNYSTTSTGPAKVTTTSVGAQALFIETHLRDVSAQYDFDSVRVGIQPVTSDFRGFVLADQPLGVRLFGTRDNDVYQYSVGWYRRLPKNAARQDEFGKGLPANDLLMANLYIQDLFQQGLTSEFVLIYDRSRVPGTQVVTDTETPDSAPTFITGARHNYDVAYLGYSADGHVGILNLTGSVYEVLGRESQGMFIDGATRVQANFAAVELSRDFDWTRLRVSGLHASGDGNPFDHRAEGFDGINQTAIFAGTDSTFFLHQRLPLVLDALDLKERDSLFPSLRPASDTGQSNFTNPGLDLVGLGTDLDLAPVLRISFDVDRLMFDRAQTLDAVLGRTNIPTSIGTDLSADAIYRPLNSQNVIVRLSASKLFAVPGARELVGGAAPFSTFVNLVLTY